MELDGYENIIERSRARKETWNKKVIEAKKRTALSGDDYSSLSGSNDVSKRQCVERASVVTDEDVSMESDVSDSFNKENEFFCPDEDLPYVPLSVAKSRGLAALKRATPVPTDEEETSSSPEESNDEIEESQGFVKSESKAKLTYDFNTPDTSAQEDDEEHTKESTDKEEISAVESTMPSSVTSGKVSSSLPIADKAQTTPVLHNTDPAELPLSARKALFERAFSRGTPKQSDSPVETKLSVAQRAAMFEKGIHKSTGVQKAFKSPKKTASPSKDNFMNGGKASTPSDSKFASPKKSHQTPDITLSPSKNASPHTLLMQEKLIDSVANDWKKKEIATKASDERKQEIAKLFNHWEKVSSSGDNTGEVYEENKEKSTPEWEKYPPVFQESENDVTELSTEASFGYDQEYVSDQSSRDDVMSYNSESVEPASFSSSVAACNAIDEALDDALEEEEDEDSVMMPPPMPALDTISRYSKKSNSSTSSTSSSGSSTSTNSHCSKGASSSQDSSNSVEKKRTSPISSEPEPVEVEPEVPLLHTVSFYRRQKQQKRAAPIRTIVRRPETQSPPSPEVDYQKQLEDKIKALQNEVLAHQTVISQTSQALNLCLVTEEFTGSTEQVEGERLLLIATQKRLACLNEIQVLKNQSAHRNHEGTGTLILNDIRLPLKQDYIQSQNSSKGGDTVHHFLCIVRHGAQVIVTEMLSAQDGVKNGSLCFTNHITLHNLSPDFSIAFEVYSLQTKKEVLTHDRKYHIKRDNKMRLTPKNKKSDSKLRSPAISSPGGPNAVRSSSFSVVGYTRFTLQNCVREICTLEKVPFSSPLEGVLRLKMQLHAEHRVTEKGFLTMFEDVSGFGAWHRRWCVLNGKELAFWKYPDDEKKKGPMLVIDLKQCTTREVKLISRDVCARPHTFELVTLRPQEKNDKNTLISRSVNTMTTTKYLLSADVKEERITWCKRLNDALTNVRKWHPQAMRPIEVKQDK